MKHKTISKPSVKKVQASGNVQELTEQIRQIIGKNPEKAAKAIEGWVKDLGKSNKKVA